METESDIKVYPAQNKTLCKTITADGTFFFANPGAMHMTAQPKLTIAKPAKTRPAAPQQSVADLASGAIARGTNILDIETPAALNEAISTGTDWFDSAFNVDQPGITPSSVILFTAKPGCGKSTLGRQLADGVTSSGNVALYNAGEESVFQVRKTCTRLNFDSGFIISCDKLIDDVLGHARQLMAKNPGKRLVLILDSLATLDDGYYKSGHINSATAVRVMDKIVEFCKETYCIAIVIGHVNKKGEFAGKQQVKHAVDAHCHMSFMNASTRRIFKYTKNRFGQLSLKGTVLDMTATGLVKMDEDIEVDIDEDEAE